MNVGFMTQSWTFCQKLVPTNKRDEIRIIHGAAKNSRYMQQTMELCAASVLVSFSDFWNLRIPSLRAIG